MIVQRICEEMNDLFSISFDDSKFRRVFGDFEAKLNRHQEMIEELQRLLRDRPTFADLDRLKGDLQKDLNDKYNQLNDKIDALQTTMNARIEQIANEVIKPEDIKFDTTGIDCQLSELNKRVKVLESSVTNNTNEIDNTKQFLQTTTNTYGAVSNTKCPLDGDLENNLMKSTDYIRNNFNNIFDSISEIRKNVDQLIKQKPVEQKPQIIEKTIVNEAPKIDLSGLELRSAYETSWDQRPRLPSLHKFEDIVEQVDYTYQLIPTLQGYLYSMYDRIENLKGAPVKSDTSHLEKLLKKLRDMIQDMSTELGQLRSSMKKGLTRREVNDLINEALAAFQNDLADTAAGSVKCIACGREVGQVAGAMSEIDALKTLGAPPNSIAFYQSPQSAGYVGQMFGCDGAMETPGQMCESPRGSRSFRASPKITRKPRGSPV